MQTIELIETVKWLDGTIPVSMKKLILEQSGWRNSIRGDKSDDPSEALKATHDLAAVIFKVAAHPFAPKVLQEFELSDLLSDELPIQIARTFATGRVPEMMTPDTEQKLYHLGRQWRLMTGMIGPVEKLTIPSAVSKEQDFDDILTLEIRTESDKKPPLSRIEDLLSAATKLYVAIAAATTKGDVSPLQVVYLTSGSGFRFDLKGLGEPMKRLKELLVEAWEKIRHRKSDDFHHNVKAVVKGLDVLAKVGAHKHLEPETRARLTHDITESMFELFEAGALPREIKTVEVVSNAVLIDDFQKRLLPAPPAKEAGASVTKKGQAPSKNRKKG